MEGGPLSDMAISLDVTGIQSIRKLVARPNFSKTRLGHEHVDVMEASQHQAAALESVGLAGAAPYGDLC